MKVDFHFHTCLSKGITFDLEFFKETLVRACEQNMFAITTTDHFDNHDFTGIYSALDDNFEYNGHYYLVEGLRLYPGVEVQVKEGPHVLVSGSRGDILAFYERLSPHRTEETYCTTADFFVKQDGLDLMNIFAHPFRPKREINRIDPALISRFDAFDINGKDLWRFGVEHRAKVEALGVEHNRPVVAGSDTHHTLQLGCVYNEFTQPFETIADLRSRIKAGAYAAHVRPELHQWVETAQETKRAIIKEARYGIKSSKFD